MGNLRFVIGLGGAAAATVLAVVYGIPALQDTETATPAETVAAAPQTAAPEDPVPEEPVRELAATEPDPEPVPETGGGEVDPLPETEGTGEPDALAAAPFLAPKIDLFRLPTDGAALIAGQSAPSRDVAVLIGDQGVARGRADAAGAFTIFLDIAPSEEARMLSLLSDPDGAATRSEESMLIAPSDIAIAEASAEETPAPEPVETAQAPDPESAMVPVAEDLASAETAASGTLDGAASGEGGRIAVSEGFEESAGTPAAETADPPPGAVVQDAADAAAADATEETAAPPVLAADATGVRVIQDAADAPPEVMSNVLLDAITYDLDGDVTLSGRAPGRGFVQVYLDNAPVTTSRIAEDGNWRTGLPTVDTGVYTLRIDEVSEEGEVVSRLETPFRREEPGVVAETMAEETADPDFQVAVRTVQPGNTLWAISRERYGRGIMYVEVFAANRDLIRNPDLIYPGQIFRLPELTPEEIAAGGQ